MGWEISFLLGFLLLFSVCVSFPSDDHYFFTDSLGIKHYVLTPEILDYGNSVDDLTNALFTKYEDPWETRPSLLTVVYFSLFFVSLYLLLSTLHTRLIPFSKLKIKNSHFSDKILLLDFWSDDGSKNLKSLQIFVIRSIHGKVLFKTLTFFFSILFISLAFFQIPSTFATDGCAGQTTSPGTVGDCQDFGDGSHSLTPSADAPVISDGATVSISGRTTLAAEIVHSTNISISGKTTLAAEITDNGRMMARISGKTTLAAEIVDIGTITISGTTTPMIFDHTTLIQNIGDIITTLKLPEEEIGSFSAIFKNVTNPTSGGNSLKLLGVGIDKIKTFTFSSSTICDDSCTISYNYTSTDAANAGINPLQVVIFMDPEEDGTYLELVTTVIDNGDGTFTATATTFSSGTDSGAGVSQAVLSLGGGGYGDKISPSFVLGFKEDEYPISIQGNNFKLPLLSNEIPTTVLETGKLTQVVVRLFENQGPSNVVYFALYTNLEDNIIAGGGTDTAIIYEKGKETNIIDPDGLFSSVELSTSEVGNKLELTLDIVFDKPMPESDIILRTWDFKRNSAQTILTDAWEVIESTSVVEFAGVITEETPEPETSETTIPDWVRNNAGWWSEGLIGDSDFASGIEFMITEGIIKVPTTEVEQEQKDVKIPEWVRINAGWWSEGIISNTEFASGLQFLIKTGIISV